MENVNKQLRKIRRVDIDDDTIIRLYVENRLSAYAIAKLLGFGQMTIRSRLIRAGVYEFGGHKIDGQTKEVEASIKIKDIESMTFCGNGLILNMADGNKQAFKITSNRILPVVSEGDDHELFQKLKE